VHFAFEIGNVYLYHLRLCILLIVEAKIIHSFLLIQCTKVAETQTQYALGDSPSQAHVNIEKNIAEST